MASQFSTLTVPELKAVAEQFGVEVSDDLKKPQLIERIEADGVTYPMYKQQMVIEAEAEEETILALLDETPLEEEPAKDVEDDEDVSLIKMTRKNGTYEVRGYRFTRDNPFALVSDEDAEFLVETGGFRPASKKEFLEYYAKI